MRVSKRKLEIAMANARVDFKTLAAKAGIAVPTVSNVLRRESCKPATAGKIANALGAKVEDIMKDDFGEKKEKSANE